jgi:ribosomal protein L29
MKKNQLKEQKSKTISELMTRIGEIRKEINKKSLELYAGKLKNVSFIRGLRREKAQIAGVIREKEINKL